MAIAEDENDIWVWDFAKETMTRLTFGAAVESAPMFSLDSRQVIFLSTTAEGQRDIFRKAVDGSGDAVALTKGGTGGEPLSFTPDGRSFLFRALPTGGNSDVMILSLDGGAPKPLLASPEFREAAAMISPDGRWIAYESTETGTAEIYVRPFPDVNGGRWQISEGGGIRPIWDRSGRALLYTTTVENFSKVAIMSVGIKPGAPFSYARPQQLFSLIPYARMFASSNYDIDASGRFLLMKGGDGPVDVRDRFVVVSNWLEEVRARTR